VSWLRGSAAVCRSLDEQPSCPSRLQSDSSLPALVDLAEDNGQTMTATIAPCASCGRNTGPGTPLFSGRRRALDRQTGSEVILCPACLPGSSAPNAAGDLPGAARFAVVDLRVMTS
jgi:hypothetical protein